MPLFKSKSSSAPVIAMHLATLRVLQNSDDISIHKKKRLSIALIVTTEQRKNDLICYYSSQHYRWKIVKTIHCMLFVQQCYSFNVSYGLLIA